MSEAEDVSWSEQLRALIRVRRYRPALTAAIVAGGVFAVECIGLFDSPATVQQYQQSPTGERNKKINLSHFNVYPWFHGGLP